MLPKSPLKRLPHKLQLTLAFVAYAIINFIYTPGQLTHTSDSLAYVAIAKESITSEAFWYAIKPVALPLLIKVCNHNDWLVSLVFFAISTLAWFLLSVSFLNTVKLHRWKIVAMIGVLIISMLPEVQIWRHLLLSESLSISLFAAITGATLLWVKKRNNYWLATAFTLSFIYIFIRDTNTYYVLLHTIAILIFLLLLTTKKQNNRISYALIIALILMLPTSMHLHETAKRWHVPMLNTFAKRILPSESATAFYEEKGLPSSQALFEMKLKKAQDPAFQKPELREFNQWFDAYGKSTYMNYLIQNPAYFLTIPYIKQTNLLTPNIEGYANTSQLLIPDEGIFFLALGGKHAWVSIPLCLIVLIGIAIKDRELKDIALYSIFILISATVMSLIYHHGDTTELSRHGIQSAIQFRLAMISTLCLMLDYVGRQKLKTPPG